MSAFTDLTGKTAFITGGASGIGRGIAEHFLEEGMNVVIGDIEEDVLAATVKELGCKGIKTDVTKPEDLVAAAEYTVAEYGAVHIVVNNAGVGSMGRIKDLSLADWRWMLEVNLFGVINGVHTFLPLLSQNPEGGHIVNTSSMAGLTSFANLGSYTTSKFGVVGLTEALARELEEDGSRVGATVLCPGPVRSNIKAGLRSRPAEETSGLFDVDASVEGPLASMRWMPAIECGRLVGRAIKNGDLYAITHPELWPLVEDRQAGVQAAFAGQPVR
ncbi:SDR family oxidoreductase [Paeniglutamicibacter sp. MACA_103]|uniref:SDR family oxidoreductase n=1 Tax=Paeniglutamicibacter sp. MACA_103 TaxID=3377337 RepID=UPI0038930362